MKVSTNSWHYKLIDKIFTPSHSLCVYFWQLVSSILLVCVACVFITIAIFVGIVIVIFVVTLLLSPILQYYQDVALIDYILSAALWIFIAVFALIYARGSYNSATRLYDAYGVRIPWYLCNLVGPDKYTKSKEPSVLVEYIKAKKQKVCPMVEFTND